MATHTSRYNPELTPEPLTHRKAKQALIRDGWRFDHNSRVWCKTENGRVWITRLREDQEGVRMDTHYLDATRKERVV